MFLSKRKFVILLFLVLFLLLSGLSFDFSKFSFIPEAQASNNYIDNIELTTQNIRGVDYLKLTFHVKTTFSTRYFFENGTDIEDNFYYLGYPQFVGSQVFTQMASCRDNRDAWLLPDVAVDYDNGYIKNIDTWATYIGNNCVFSLPCYEFTWLAGNTYSVYLYSGGNVYLNPYKQFGSDATTSYFLSYDLNCLQNATLHLNSVGNNLPVNEDLHFTVYPTLTITYPPNHYPPHTDEDIIDEVAGDFNITGTVTQPSPYEYNEIVASFGFYNEWGKNEYIGEFTAPLSATSSQSFTIPIIGLPVSEPGSLEVLIQLRKVSNGQVLDSYGTTASPWNFIMKTVHEDGYTPPASSYPEWHKYFDIYAPSPSSDGYYHLTPPTSSVEFIYNFPETYKVWIYQGESTKLATSTFASLDIDFNKRFIVDNFDATSTPSYIHAVISNSDDEVIIDALFPVIETSAGETQNTGFWGEISDFISRTASSLFVPSPAVISKVSDGYRSLLTSKIPFSYFYDIKNVFASSTVGTATSLDSTVHIDIAGSDVSFPIFDVPDELTETDAYRTFYDFLRVGCYFMYVYYIIDRVRGMTEEGSD